MRNSDRCSRRPHWAHGVRFMRFADGLCVLEKTDVRKGMINELFDGKRHFGCESEVRSAARSQTDHSSENSAHFLLKPIERSVITRSFIKPRDCR